MNTHASALTLTSHTHAQKQIKKNKEITKEAIDAKYIVLSFLQRSIKCKLMIVNTNSKNQEGVNSIYIQYQNDV